MILVNKPEKKAQESGSPVFQELKGICLVLGMSKPPANITMIQFFSGIEKKVSWSGDMSKSLSKLFHYALFSFYTSVLYDTRLHVVLFFLLLAKRSYRQSSIKSYRRAFDEEGTWTCTLGKFSKTI